MLILTTTDCDCSLQGEHNRINPSVWKYLCICLSESLHTPHTENPCKCFWGSSVNAAVHSNKQAACFWLSMCLSQLYTDTDTVKSLCLIQLQAVPHADMQSFSSWTRPRNPHCCCWRLEDRENAVLSVCTSCTASSDPENSGLCGVSLEVCEGLQIWGADRLFWSRKWTFLRCCSSDTWTRICWISASIWTHISSSVYRKQLQFLSWILTNPSTRFTVFTETTQEVFKV